MLFAIPQFRIYLATSEQSMATERESRLNDVDAAEICYGLLMARRRDKD